VKEVAVADEPGEVESHLVDLTEVDLTDLAALDNSVLASALRHLRDEIEHPEEAVAGFNSSL
jgi:FXSXX-COOH protein